MNACTFRGTNPILLIVASNIYWGLLIKERICSHRSKFFPLRVDPILGRLRPLGNCKQTGSLENCLPLKTWRKKMEVYPNSLNVVPSHYDHICSMLYPYERSEILVHLNLQRNTILDWNIYWTGMNLLALLCFSYKGYVSNHAFSMSLFGPIGHSKTRIENVCHHILKRNRIALNS